MPDPLHGGPPHGPMIACYRGPLGRPVDHCGRPVDPARCAVIVDAPPPMDTPDCRPPGVPGGHGRDDGGAVGGVDAPPIVPSPVVVPPVGGTDGICPELQTLLDGCQSCMNACDDAVRKGVKGSLAECQAACGQCDSTILGYLGFTLDVAGQAWAKTGQKIRASIEQTIAVAGAYCTMLPPVPQPVPNPVPGTGDCQPSTCTSEQCYWNGSYWQDQPAYEGQPPSPPPPDCGGLIRPYPGLGGSPPLGVPSVPPGDDGNTPIPIPGIGGPPSPGPGGGPPEGESCPIVPPTIIQIMPCQPGATGGAGGAGGSGGSGPPGSSYTGPPGGDGGPGGSGGTPPPYPGPTPAPAPTPTPTCPPVQACPPIPPPPTCESPPEKCSPASESYTDFLSQVFGSIIVSGDSQDDGSGDGKLLGGKGADRLGGPGDSDPGCPVWAGIADVFTFDPARMAESLGWTSDPDGSNKKMPLWARIVYNGLPPGIDDAFFGITKGALDEAGFVLSAINGAGMCPSPVNLISQVGLAVLGAIKRWIGADIPNVEHVVRQTLAMSCPTLIPGRSEYDGAYLASTIDYDTWRCGVRSNETHENDAWPVMQAKRSRPSDNDYIRLKWKGGITPEQLYVALSKNGWTDSDEIDAKEASMKYVVPPSDLVRFMVRDVFDDAVVENQQLGAEFAAKYGPDAKAIALANGMTDDQMSLYWEGHWKYPSPQQAYQMLQRLRPDAPGVAADVVTTAADVSELLGIEDYAKPWRDALMAISYRVVDKNDARLMFYTGAEDEDRYNNRLQDLGYSYDDSRAIVELEKHKKNEWAWRKAGGPTPKQVVLSYANGEIPASVAQSQLETLSISEDLATQMLAAAQAKVFAQRNKRMIAAVGRAFKRAAIGPDGATEALMGLGLDADQTLEWIAEWSYTLALSPKQPSVSQLCDWRKANLISHGEYVARLERLGYKLSDAEDITTVCEMRAQGTYPKPPKPPAPPKPPKPPKPAPAPKPAPCPTTTTTVTVPPGGPPVVTTTTTTKPPKPPRPKPKPPPECLPGAVCNEEI